MDKADIATDATIRKRRPCTPTDFSLSLFLSLSLIFSCSLSLARARSLCFPHSRSLLLSLSCAHALSLFLSLTHARCLHLSCPRALSLALSDSHSFWRELPRLAFALSLSPAHHGYTPVPSYPNPTPPPRPPPIFSSRARLSLKGLSRRVLPSPTTIIISLLLSCRPFPLSVISGLSVPASAQRSHRRQHMRARERRFPKILHHYSRFFLP
jgi:hypothetical protein